MFQRHVGLQQQQGRVGLGRVLSHNVCNTLLVPHSAWSIGLFTVFFHLFLSIAVLTASVHVLNPI